MKITIKGFIHRQNSYRYADGSWSFFSCDMSEYGYILVMPYELTVDLPEDYDPVKAEVESLRKAQKAIRAELTRKGEMLEERIQSLLAIEGPK